VRYANQGILFAQLCGIRFLLYKDYVRPVEQNFHCCFSQSHQYMFAI